MANLNFNILVQNQGPVVNFGLNVHEPDFSAMPPLDYMDYILAHDPNYQLGNALPQEALEQGPAEDYTEWTDWAKAINPATIQEAFVSTKSLVYALHICVGGTWYGIAAIDSKNAQGQGRTEEEIAAIWAANAGPIEQKIMLIANGHHIV